MKKYVKPIIIILSLIVLIFGARYYFLGPSLSCMEDRGGVYIYIPKSNLPVYENEIKNGDKWKVMDHISKNESVYAEISTNCYAKQSSIIKSEKGLIDVNYKTFSKYLTEEFKSANYPDISHATDYCTYAVRLYQHGNSPIFVSDNFCRFEW